MHKFAVAHSYLQLILIVSACDGINERSITYDAAPSAIYDAVSVVAVSSNEPPRVPSPDASVIGGRAAGAIPTSDTKVVAPLTPTSSPRPKDLDLAAAMIEFVQGLRARDVEKLVALLPKQRPLKLSSTIVGTSSFAYEEAAAGMRARNRDDGLYSVLLDASDPTFAQYVLDGVEWTWVGGTRFVPDGGDVKSPVYVTWRKERGRWVIDTIGFPLA